MKLSLLSLVIGSAAAFAPAPSARTSVATNAALDDLKSIAEKSNPVLKVCLCPSKQCSPDCVQILCFFLLTLYGFSFLQFYDPLELSSTTIWGNTNDETIAFLRQSEIKHGRVAVS